MSSGKRKTTEEFISEAKTVHGDQYDYSRVNYIKSDKKVEIICPKHGPFWPLPNNFLKGCGCTPCSITRRSLKRMISSEKILERIKEIHGDTYDYSKVVYLGSDKQIEVVCPIHGSFHPTVSNFMSGKGCKKCADERNTLKQRSPEEEVLNKFRLKHGDQYDYSRVKYRRTNVKVEIICTKHGSFWQTPHLHLRGNEGCSSCIKEKGSPKKKKQEKAIQELIESRKKFENKYLYEKSVYTGYSNNIIITCLKHGDFEQAYNNHKRGDKCSKCPPERENPKLTFHKNKFIERANKVHHHEYDYSKAVYLDSNKKLCIVCKKHGDFWKTPHAHINGKQGCPFCNSSQGENRVKTKLEEMRIFYKQQFRFEKCRFKNPLPFDFAIFEDEERTKLKMLVEFDGDHHFKAILRHKKDTQEKAEERLRKTKVNDAIKTQYCLDHNIPLLRIPYWDFERIEEILEEALKF